MARSFTRPRSDQEKASRTAAGLVTRPARPLPGGTPEGPVKALEEHLAASRGHLNEIAQLLQRQSGPGVLETATITIPSQSQEAGFEPGAPGVFTQDRYRVPYAAVFVINPSAAPLIVSSGPAQGAPPGGGQGQFTVPANSYVAMNMAGSSLSIYGAAGTVVSYSVLTGRIQPSAGALGQAPTGTSFPAFGTATAPGPGATIAQTAVPPAGQYSVTVIANIAGTPAQGTDSNNLALRVNGATFATLADDIAAGQQTFGPYSVLASGTNVISVQSVAAGTAGAVYSVNIIATPAPA